MEREIRNHANEPSSPEPLGSDPGEIEEILRMAKEVSEGMFPKSRNASVKADAGTEFRPIIDRLERMSTLTETGIKLGKSGNGWTPERIVEVSYQVEPMPVEQSKMVIARSKYLGLASRLRSSLSFAGKSKEITGEPIAVHVPIWYAEGFHECYYLRAGSYKVDVSSDVVAVEVEGQTRDLRVGYQGRKLIPDAITRRLQRLGSIFLSQSKYFYLDGVVELAKSRGQGSTYVSGDGRKGELLEEVIDPDWKLKRIFDQRDLIVAGAEVRSPHLEESRNRLLSVFKERVLRMPTNFKEILSNQFEIATLAVYYLPYYYFRLGNGAQSREVVIHGVTGERAENGVGKYVGRLANIPRATRTDSTATTTAS
jgi:hypothetical protein